jgi:DNA processing protein
MKHDRENSLILALAIARIPGLGSAERLRLWDRVDDERSLSLLLPHDVYGALGREAGRATWAPELLFEAARRDARFLEGAGGVFLRFGDKAYPAALRETVKPPFGLYARGSGIESAMSAFALADSVAIVGTRMPTGRGLEHAYSLARELCASGVPIVSGLARGIDAASHRGALAAAAEGRGFSVPTCAVLPCGIDRVYPPRNKALASAIVENGGILLSEYPPGTEIRKYRFPERNRIIAGLARACIVVEAPAKSGALITAEHALDEGRDVWVSAECLGGQRSAGIDRLEADGAQPISRAEDLLGDWEKTAMPIAVETSDGK